MLTPDDIFAAYAGHSGITDEHRANAEELCGRVNALLERAEADGVVVTINPKTGTQISGNQNGGWRPQSCSIGAPNSAHKQGMAVDLFDPGNVLDRWIMQRPKVDGWPDVLVELELSIEHPDATPGWCHLDTRVRASGNRVFRPQ